MQNEGVGELSGSHKEICFSDSPTWSLKIIQEIYKITQGRKELSTDAFWPTRLVSEVCIYVRYSLWDIYAS